jgi:nucleotide-binding universal stress UspA family protein
MKKLVIHKILVPVDFSNNSMNALQTAVALAKVNNASIRLLHVIDEDYKFSDMETIKGHTTTDIYIRAITRLAHSVKNSDNITCDFGVVEGSITANILREASEYGADIIIMGKNGNAGARKNYAGAVAYQIIKKSVIPVLIIPVGKTYESFTEILFPSRPILSVLDKYDAIEDFIHSNNASLHIQNLRHPDHSNEVHIISHLTEIIKQKAEKKGLKTHFEYYFENGRFSEFIIEKISENNLQFDLLIITAEIDRRVKDFYIGNYALNLVHQSPVPVLVLRPDKVILPREKVLEKLETDYDLIN